MTTVLNRWFRNTSVIQRDPKAPKGTLVFRHWDPDEMIEGKKMGDLLPFSVAMWHSFCNPLSDPFGVGTRDLPWNADAATSPLKAARCRAEAMFEFCQKCGTPGYCFHNWDAAPDAEKLADSEANLREATKWLKDLQGQTGIRLAWGTANLFTHPRYARGAATSCHPKVFRRAAAEVRTMMDVTRELGGKCYTLWGGREGYLHLINTLMKKEFDQLAVFLQIVADYAQGLLLQIEPKAKEPTAHQYDTDVAACLALLRAIGLAMVFKMNIEANHATLAMHTFEHELLYADANGVFGGIDANEGDLMTQWDTDHFPTTLYPLISAMLLILERGGMGPHWINFDAKLRRTSTDPEDLFWGHVAGMEAWAIAAKVAAAIRKDGLMRKIVEGQYAAWNGDLGQAIMGKKMSLAQLREAELADQEPFTLPSGREEKLRGILNEYLVGVPTSV